MENIVKDIQKMNKQGEYKESLILEEQEQENNLMIPWVNEPRLQQEISISWDTWETVNLQNQIDSLDARVTALENP